MRRGKAVVLLLAGGIVLGAEAHNQFTKFSDQQIWERQRPLIERAIRNPEQRQSRINQLRNGLLEFGGGLENSDREIVASGKERCIFETRFAALTETRGNEEAAEQLISNRNFEPFAHCEPEARFTRSATKWYSLAGAAAFFIGLVGFVRSFGRRKENQ
ncbi:hypothetical protein KKB44_01530 [Candidatus Micrarchaeota archaeon]|nr:hypothetical protein [Candidatus Micrarchaeota archaeon]